MLKIRRERQKKMRGYFYFLQAVETTSQSVKPATVLAITSLINQTTNRPTNQPTNHHHYQVGLKIKTMIKVVFGSLQKKLVFEKVWDFNAIAILLG